jgi:uncharacterized lipoprotein YmbA
VRIRSTAAFLVVLLLAGCGFFRQQKKNYYSLETVPSETQSVARTGIPIGIDSVELPPPIDRREIVVRQADGKLELRGSELWSAPIKTMTVHTLAFDLAGRLPEGMVILPGQAKPVAGMRSIYVVIEEFAAGPESVLVLDARWILRTPGASDLTHHERIDVPVSSLGSAEIAAAMSRALSILAERIVAALP